MEKEGQIGNCLKSIDECNKVAPERFHFWTVEYRTIAAHNYSSTSSVVDLTHRMTKSPVREIIESATMSSIVGFLDGRIVPMPSMRRSTGLVLFWRFHRWLMRLTKGRLGSRLMGNTVLLLTTTGRKSGQPRETALYTFPDGDNYIVVASNVGEDKHPGWYLNLRENPEASILIGGRQRAVRAREAQGDARERLWEMVTARDANYAEYQTWTARKIPVIVLETRDQGDGSGA